MDKELILYHLNIAKKEINKLLIISNNIDDKIAEEFQRDAKICLRKINLIIDKINKNYDKKIIIKNMKDFGKKWNSMENLMQNIYDVLKGKKTYDQ